METIIRKFFEEDIKTLFDDFLKIEKKIKIENEKYLGNILEAHVVDYFSNYLIKNNFFSFKELNINAKKLLLDEYIKDDKYKDKKRIVVDLYFTDEKDRESYIVEFKNKHSNQGGYSMSDIIRVNDFAKLFNLNYGIFICTNIKKTTDITNMKNGIKIINNEIFQNENGELLKIAKHKTKITEIFKNEIENTNYFATIIIFSNENLKLKERIEEKNNLDNIIKKLTKTEEIREIIKKLENEIENEIENEELTSIKRKNIEEYINIMEKVTWINDWNEILGLNVFSSVIKKIESVGKPKINLFLNNSLKDFNFYQKCSTSSDALSHLFNIWKKNLKEKGREIEKFTNENESVSVQILNKRSVILKSLFFKWITIKYKSDKNIDEIFLKKIKASIDEGVIKNIWSTDKTIEKASQSAFEAIVWLIKLNEEFKFINNFLWPRYKKIKKNKMNNFIDSLKLFLLINNSKEIDKYEICDKILLWDKNNLKIKKLNTT